MTADATLVNQTRDLLVYVAAYLSSNVMPPDSAWGTSWGAPYADAGYTDGGLRFGMTFTFSDIHVDQLIDPIATIGTARDVRVSTNLAQFTLPLLKTATSQGVITTLPAVSGTRGHTDMALDNTLAVAYQTVGFDIHQIGDGESLRVVLWHGQPRANVATTFQPTAKAMIPLEVQAFPDSANANRIMTLRDISAALP